MAPRASGAGVHGHAVLTGHHQVTGRHGGGRIVERHQQVGVVEAERGLLWRSRARGRELSAGRQRREQTRRGR